MEQPFDVVCVGHATLDRVALVAGRPPRDGRVYAADLAEGGGGPAATAAVTLARLGRRVAVVAAVGDDPAGRRIRDELAGEGVDIRDLELVDGARSPGSLIVADSRASTRTIIAFAGTAGPIQLRSGAIDRCRHAAWVHVDRRGYEPIRLVRHELRASRLSVDAGHAAWPIDLRSVDLFAPSADFLAARYPGLRRDRAMRAALEEGARAVVVTLGAAGSTARTADGSWRAAGFPVDVRSTLGAGDVFHGALLDALLRETAMPEALRWANMAAALSCRGLDGRSAIPTADELRRHPGARG